MLLGILRTRETSGAWFLALRAVSYVREATGNCVQMAFELGHMPLEIHVASGRDTIARKERRSLQLDKLQMNYIGNN